MYTLTDTDGHAWMQIYSYNFTQTQLQVLGKATDRHTGSVSAKTDRHTQPHTERQGYTKT